MQLAPKERWFAELASAGCEGDSAEANRKAVSAIIGGEFATHLAMGVISGAAQPLL